MKKTAESTSNHPADFQLLLVIATPLDELGMGTAYFSTQTLYPSHTRIEALY